MEFKDVFEEIYEKENAETSQELKEKFDKEAVDPFRRALYRN